MDMLIDHLLHGGELVSMIVVAVVTVKSLGRLEGLLKDYPPHRHVNGKILFPAGFEPTEVQTLDVKSRS